MQKYILSIIVIIVLFLSGEAAQSQYYLGVIQGESKKIPIAVLDIYDDMGNPKVRALALDVLQADLRRSQIFEIMDPKKLALSYSEKTEPMENIIKRGGTFGLTGIVWASVRRKGKDIVLAGKLYDATSGMRIANKDYFGNDDAVRRMVHTFADEAKIRDLSGNHALVQNIKLRASDIYLNAINN